MHYAHGAGIVLLQLSLPNMRTERGLRNFNAVYGPKFDYDLQAWRESLGLPKREFELLDAEDGAGEIPCGSHAPTPVLE